MEFSACVQGKRMFQRKLLGKELLLKKEMTIKMWCCCEFVLQHWLNSNRKHVPPQGGCFHLAEIYFSFCVGTSPKALTVQTIHLMIQQHLIQSFSTSDSKHFRHRTHLNTCSCLDAPDTARVKSGIQEAKGRRTDKIKHSSGLSFGRKDFSRSRSHTPLTMFDIIRFLTTTVVIQHR